MIQRPRPPRMSLTLTSKGTEKKVAYQKKVEESGNNVVKYIFCGLILLAILFVIYSVYIVS